MKAWAKIVAVAVGWAIMAGSAAAAGKFVVGYTNLADTDVFTMSRKTAFENAVKASYLYKFAPFVQWPPAALGASAAPFTICVAGSDPFGPALDEAVRGGGQCRLMRRSRR